MKQTYISPKAIIVEKLPENYCLSVKLLSNLEDGFGFGQLDDDTLNEE